MKFLSMRLAGYPGVPVRLVAKQSAAEDPVALAPFLVFSLQAYSLGFDRAFRTSPSSLNLNES